MCIKTWKREGGVGGCGLVVFVHRGSTVLSAASCVVVHGPRSLIQLPSRKQQRGLGRSCLALHRRRWLRGARDGEDSTRDVHAGLVRAHSQKGNLRVEKRHATLLHDDARHLLNKSHGLITLWNICSESPPSSNKGRENCVLSPACSSRHFSCRLTSDVPTTLARCSDTLPEVSVPRPTIDEIGDFPFWESARCLWMGKKHRV